MSCAESRRTTKVRRSPVRLFVATVAPPPIKEINDVKQILFPWIPDWVDLNIAVPIGATVVVIIVGIVVICVALSRRSRGPEQTRLRSDCMSLQAENVLIFIKKISGVIF